ncbi:hypothetical protein ACIPSA_51155 [Streptomyces sp. NPDC086549]|uniref:hypothetical protein n=1 Tax=Streptomyces sp. NPDC086549 TaxID=3365752 RepID=UPI0038008CFF
MEFDFLVVLAPGRAHLGVAVRLEFGLGQPGGPQVAEVVGAGGLDRPDAEFDETGVDQVGVTAGTEQPGASVSSRCSWWAASAAASQSGTPG